MICDFCYRHCDIKEGNFGVCESRMCKNGQIISPYYGALCAIAVDPVEKKPLYHYHPGKKTLSIAQEGCNFFCSFCQNHTISRYHRMREKVAEDDIVSYAIQRGIPSVSYTYSEPLVWQDYMLSVSKKAKAKGLENIMVSNGSFSDESLERILPLIDAFNIDLKGDEAFYRTFIKASSDPVRASIRRIARSSAHLEVTTMVIEDIQTPNMIRELGSFLREAGVKVWHLTRFFPSYLLSDRKETSESYLMKIYEVARESGIPYIYRGNTAFHDETICPSCGKRVDRYRINGKCPNCGELIYGKF